MAFVHRKTFCHLFFIIVITLLFSLDSYLSQQNDPKVDSAHSTIPKIITVGPGIQNTDLPFTSRYFFILHQNPRLNSVQIRPKKQNDSNHSKRCLLWSQLFNETQFCLHLNYSDLNNPSRFENFEDILDKSMFCDDEMVVQNNKNRVPYMAVYWLSIIRYTLYRSQLQCEEQFELIIRDQGDSNIQIYQRDLFTSKVLYSDWCHCPRSDWSEEMKCHSKNNQLLQRRIFEDLKHFNQGINFTIILNEAKKRFAEHPLTYAFCQYKIRKNQAFKKCYGEYVGFSKFFDKMLLSLMRKTFLSDNEFLMNLGDLPLSDVSRHPPLPIFSWCGSTDTHDIVLPTYELTESILNDQGRISTDILSIFGNQKMPFTRKKNRLFWRGRDSNRARLRLIEHSFKKPELYDAAITNFFFFRDEMHKYQTNKTNGNYSTGTKNNYVSFLNFFSNRYQINIDGTVAAYRFPFLLAGNSLVLKQQSKYYEFFYDMIKDLEHYVLVDQNLSQLPAVIKSLVEQGKIPDHENVDIKKIIWQARISVLKYLLPSSTYCYYYNALESYRRLLLEVDQSKISTNMELVHDVDIKSEDSMFLCNCDKQNTHFPIHTKEEL